MSSLTDKVWSQTESVLRLIRFLTKAYQYSGLMLFTVERYGPDWLIDGSPLRRTSLQWLIFLCASTKAPVGNHGRHAFFARKHPRLV